VPSSEDSEIGTSERESDCRVRYGSSWVSAASALPLDGGISRPRPMARLIAAAVLRPRRLTALIVLILRIRREYVVLSESRAGQALDAYFNERLFGIPRNRFCRGVVLLPQDHADYLRGRRRRALRTNLRRAAAVGIRCDVVSDSRRANDDASHLLRRYWDSLTDTVLHARIDDIRAVLARPETTVTVARDEHGRPLAVAAAVIDDMVCLIELAVATSHEARWALHDYLVRILIARRVRYLLSEGGGLFGALGFTNNVQHYQHLLGYELRHVIPATPRPTTLRRRLVASLVVVAAAATLIVPRAAASTAGLIPLGPVTGARSHATVRSAPATSAAESGPSAARHGLGDAPLHRFTIGQSSSQRLERRGGTAGI
jgi:hypothetical protein